MDPIKAFQLEREGNIKKLGKNKELKKIAENFIIKSSKIKYVYNFNWLGRPIIQFPQEIVAIQEIIWSVKPDLIIETGIAHGGSIILSASILELIGKNGLVVGIDIDIRKHNKKLIKAHFLFKRIRMLEGSSIDMDIYNQAKKITQDKKKVMVFLDSNHTYNHVWQELCLYSKLVSKNSYIVVFDTVTEIIPKEISKNRPWGKGNNPKTAVDRFLRENKNFVVDKNINNKLLITTNPGGYLKKIS